MSGQLNDDLWGTIGLIAGVIVLQNQDALLRLDKTFWIGQRGWFHKQLGDTFLNRSLWATENPIPSRLGKIMLRIVGVSLLIFGATYLFEPLRFFLH